MTTVIRDATERDLPSVLDIFNHEIIASTVVYLDHAPSLAERTSWWAGESPLVTPRWAPKTNVE